MAEVDLWPLEPYVDDVTSQPYRCGRCGEVAWGTSRWIHRGVGPCPCRRGINGMVSCPVRRPSRFPRVKAELVQEDKGFIVMITMVDRP